MAPLSNVLVINAGSSSVKYQVIELPKELVRDKGTRDRVGIPGGDFSSHREALSDVLSSLPSEIAIHLVAHRVVHGGQLFHQPTPIDIAVLTQIQQLSTLALLHNPANAAGIEAAIEVVPDVPHIAIFDTAFFASLPPAAYTYALPREAAKEHGLRKYGFHGTSHQFVSKELESLSDRHLPHRRVVTFHLGNGSSVSAVKGGQAIDTSMGFTPLAGLVMGTRSGDLDPAIPLYLQSTGGMSVDDVDSLLNRESGLLGLSGYSDMRDLFSAADGGDLASQAAIDVWVWRARHYLGAYIAHLGGVDAVVFTGGIGENQPELRRRIVDGLEELGIVLNPSLNSSPDSRPRRVSEATSPVEVWVIPTNEELQMARLAHQVVNGQR